MNNLTRDDVQSIQPEEGCDQEILYMKIKAHLEDLFSDSHLAEDGFLLKHVQKNKQGYVNLKLLTCLKRIKVLTTSWYMTLAGALHSDLLEVNDDCTKVRRKEPLPKWLLCSPTSKLLLAWNISEDQSRGDGANLGPEDPSLSARILQKFSAHGSVTSLWILPPDKQLPKELQRYAKHHKELGQRLCAVVRFDNLESVRRAYNALKVEEEKSNGNGMCVVPLGFQSTHLHKDKSSEENTQPEEDMPSTENPPEISKDLVQQEPSSPNTHQPQTSVDISAQRAFDQTFTGCDNKSLSVLNQRYSRSNWCSETMGDNEREKYHSPWVLRRRSAASVLNSKAAGCLNAPGLILRVLRQPFGPDGTKGFHGRRRLLQQEEIKLY